MMETFKFRLEKVWLHRQKLVDENSLALAEADRKVNGLAKDLVEIQRNIDRQARDMVPREGMRLSANELITGGTWLDHLRQLEEDLNIQLQSAIKDLEHSRARLTDSWRDLEVLSKLRGRQQEDWRAERNKRERKEMDEVGQIRVSRRKAAKDSP